MRILITSESYYPNVSGVAVFSYYLAKNMALRGHQVFILTAGEKKQKKYKIEKENGNTIYRLKSVYNPFRKGYRFTLWPYISVKKIIDQIQPDLIHMQDPSPISMCTLFVSRKKTPIIITNHFSLDYILSYLKLPAPFDSWLKSYFSKYLRWFYAHAEILTCPTPTVARYLKQKNIHQNALAISNGVDLEQFFPYYGDTDKLKIKYQIPLNEKIVLYVGRFDKDKKVEILIRAMTKILAEKNGVHFILCGDGKQRKKYLHLIERTGIKNKVTVIGFLGHHKEIPRIYQMANVFATPSPIETQGIVVLEAMASALPVVGADAGALPELIKNNINGFTFNLNDENDFAEKILKILNDEKMARKMGERGLELVEKHSLEKTYDKFEKIYGKVVAKN